MIDLQHITRVFNLANLGDYRFELEEQLPERKVKIYQAETLQFELLVKPANCKLSNFCNEEVKELFFPSYLDALQFLVLQLVGAKIGSYFEALSNPA